MQRMWWNRKDAGTLNNPQTIAMPTKLTLEYYLEMVIWEDVPNGTQMNAAKVYRRMANATDDQLARAGVRFGRKINYVSE